MMGRGKQRFIILLPVLVCFTGMLALSVFWLHECRQSAFEHISKLCEIIIENSPEAEEQVLSSVKEYYTLTEQEIKGSTFLTQYGYRSDEFSKELEWNFLTLSFAVFLVTICCFLISARYVDKQRRMRIAELTAYLEQINVGCDGTVV